MSLFDQPQPPVGADAAAPWGARAAVVLLCAAVAFAYGYARAPFYESAFARAVGATVALLLLPAIVALIAWRSTPRWHVAFAVTFAVVFGLALLGSLAR